MRVNLAQTFNWSRSGRPFGPLSLVPYDKPDNGEFVHLCLTGVA